MLGKRPLYFKAVERYLVQELSRSFLYEKMTAARDRHSRRLDLNRHGVSKTFAEQRVSFRVTDH